MSQINPTMLFLPHPLSSTAQAQLPHGPAEQNQFTDRTTQWKVEALRAPAFLYPTAGPNRVRGTLNSPAPVNFGESREASRWLQQGKCVCGAAWPPRLSLLTALTGGFLLARSMGRPVGHPRSSGGAGSWLFPSPERGCGQKAGREKQGWECSKGLFLFVWGEKRISNQKPSGKRNQNRPKPRAGSRFERGGRAMGEGCGSDAVLIENDQESCGS